VLVVLDGIRQGIEHKLDSLDGVNSIWGFSLRLCGGSLVPLSPLAIGSCHRVSA
jgi:hypothetical protein